MDILNGQRERARQQVRDGVRCGGYRSEQDEENVNAVMIESRFHGGGKEMRREVEDGRDGRDGKWKRKYLRAGRWEMGPQAARRNQASDQVDLKYGARG